LVGPTQCGKHSNARSRFLSIEGYGGQAWSLDATRTMALTACACWERSIGWPSAKLRVQMVQGDGGSGGVGTQWLDLLTRQSSGYLPCRTTCAPIRTVASRS